jgi:vesicle coat complex subunit
LQEVKKTPTPTVSQEFKKTPTPTVTQEIKKTPTPTVSQEIKKTPTPTPTVSQEFKRPTAVITQVSIVQKNSDKNGNFSQDQVQEIRKPIREEAKLNSPLIREEAKMASPLSKHETLKKIQKLNDEGDDNIWERSIKDILNMCEECAEENSLTENALMIFHSIAKKRKSLCQNYINDCLRIMSKGFYLDNRHILQTTEESMEELVMGLSASNIIPIVIQYVKTHDSPATQAFIRILTKIIMATNPTGLMGLMRIIINQMKDSLNHSNADVRKSVVFCLVEIQVMMQVDFAEYLEELTPSQQKLVTIYIQRRLSS